MSEEFENNEQQNEEKPVESEKSEKEESDESDESGEEEEKQEEEIEEEPAPTVQSGDEVLVTGGEYKGELAKVISPYTNSISIELEKRDEDGAKPRTVLRHTEYEIVEKAE
ncbi:hypothetical protein [Alkalicoccus chagannorensis]|uniref:hypothetical protein n=1 Tax=Alkalicoccus chagannorensis TaxID=427072 RepID=UPI00040BC865|nr:hypothetical protein [Alkalicoccus chagannorensis]